MQACSCLLGLQISFTPAPAQRTQSRKQAIHKLLAKMFTLAGKTRVPHFLEHLVGINENSNKSMVSRYGLPTHAREFQSPAKQINTAPHEHKKKLDSNLSEHFMCAACLSPVCWFSAASCLLGVVAGPAVVVCPAWPAEDRGWLGQEQALPPQRCRRRRHCLLLLRRALVLLLPAMRACTPWIHTAAG